MTGTGSTASSRDTSLENIARLIVAMDASQPLAPPQQVSLGPGDSLSISRGPVARVATGDVPGETRLQLRDPLMSARHARIFNTGTGWVVQDTASKNGTFIDGEPVSMQALHDGAVIEMGHNFCVFRAVDKPPCVHASPESSDLPPALETMSLALEHRFSWLGKIAPSEVSILIRGDSGTGKELTARAVHELSGRTGNLVAINCGAIAETLLESELFGACKGAYSGAAEARSGLVRAADKGTLFLDEIAELSATSQVALLRVIEERQVVPVGGTRPVDVDVRFIAATHQNLASRIAAGSFRHDLYARINGFEISLPALCERREDLGLLCASILRQLRGDEARSIRFRRAATRALLAYEWPGNIRELRHALATALEVAPASVIEPGHLPEAVRRSGHLPSVPGRLGLRDRDQLERRLRRLLTEHGGNISAVARALGKQRQQIHRWVRELGIDTARFRARGGEHHLVEPGK